MKKITEELVKVEVAYCNICDKEMGEVSIKNRERMVVLYGLFKMVDFDAHEACVNKVIRAAFKPYFPQSRK